MIRLGLVGYPLEHSISPVLHQAALRSSGLQGEYVLHAIPPGHTTALHDLVDLIRVGEMQGLNVTIPHKHSILPFLDGLTPEAKAIGAVNTIYLKDGLVVGDNTDFAGFLADVQKWQLIPRSSIVLGAGGAARAVIYALERMNCTVHVASRRGDAACELAREFSNAVAIQLDRDALWETKPDLLVNATPAGMFPNIEGCAWPAGLPLPHSAAVYDLVYNPPETRLMSEARKAGLRATNGLGMLIEQAALAFEIWTGISVAREHLADAIPQMAG